MTFKIALDGNKILVGGDLTASDKSRLDSFFRGLGAGTYRISAHETTLDPPAVEAWIEVVNSLDGNRKLVYEQSQLGMILEDDERYLHPSSTFADPYSRASRDSWPTTALRA